MEKLQLSQKTYEELKQELAEKIQALRELEKFIAEQEAKQIEVLEDDSFFQQKKMEEKELLRQVIKLQTKLSNSEIFKGDEKEENEGAKLGSIVTVEIQDDFGTEEMEFKLGSNYSRSGIDTVSIDSPLGGCVYERQVGYEGKYTVNGNTFGLKILKICNEK